MISDQARAHFLRHENGRPHETQILSGRSARVRMTQPRIPPNAVALHGVHAGAEARLPQTPSHEPHKAALHNTTLFAKGRGDKNSVSLNDIKQQQLGDLFFLSAMGAELMHHPNLIKNLIHEHHGKHGPTYTVDFHEKGGDGAYKVRPSPSGTASPRATAAAISIAAISPVTRASTGPARSGRWFKSIAHIEVN